MTVNAAILRYLTRRIIFWTSQNVLFIITLILCMSFFYFPLNNNDNNTINRYEISYLVGRDTLSLSIGILLIIAPSFLNKRTGIQSIVGKWTSWNLDFLYLILGILYIWPAAFHSTIFSNDLGIQGLTSPAFAIARFSALFVIPIHFYKYRQDHQLEIKLNAAPLNPWHEMRRSIYNGISKFIFYSVFITFIYLIMRILPDFFSVINNLIFGTNNMNFTGSIIEMISDSSKTNKRRSNSLFSVTSVVMLTIDVGKYFFEALNLFKNMYNCHIITGCIATFTGSSLLFLLLTVAHDSLEQCILYPVSFEKLQTQKNNFDTESGVYGNKWKWQHIIYGAIISAMIRNALGSSILVSTSRKAREMNSRSFSLEESVSSAIAAGPISAFFSLVDVLLVLYIVSLLIIMVLQSVYKSLHNWWYDGVDLSNAGDEFASPFQLAIMLTTDDLEPPLVLAAEEINLNKPDYQLMSDTLLQVLDKAQDNLLVGMKPTTADVTCLPYFIGEAWTTPLSLAKALAWQDLARIGRFGGVNLRSKLVEYHWPQLGLATCYYICSFALQMETFTATLLCNTMESSRVNFDFQGDSQCHTNSLALWNSAIELVKLQYESKKKKSSSSSSSSSLSSSKKSSKGSPDKERSSRSSSSSSSSSSQTEGLEKEKEQHMNTLTAQIRRSVDSHRVYTLFATALEGRKLRMKATWLHSLTTGFLSLVSSTVPAAYTTTVRTWLSKFITSKDVVPSLISQQVVHCIDVVTVALVRAVWEDPGNLVRPFLKPVLRTLLYLEQSLMAYEEAKKQAAAIRSKQTLKDAFIFRKDDSNDGKGISMIKAAVTEGLNRVLSAYRVELLSTNNNDVFDRSSPYTAMLRQKLNTL